MKITSTSIGLFSLLLVQACAPGSHGETASSLMSLQKAPPITISKDRAIVIANNDMTANGESPYNYKIVPCELTSWWLITYDRGGPEYVIDKETETILDKQEITQGREVTEKGLMPPRADVTLTSAAQADIKFDKNYAIDLTTKDAKSRYRSLDDFKPTACELSNAWRVIFESKIEMSGGGPDYVVDKHTGLIIYKRYNQ